MAALAVGVLIVLGSSVAFGAAMFGRRPVPQPATARSTPHPVTVAAPSSGVPAEAPPGPSERGGRRAAGLLEPRVEVTIPRQVKVRAALLLALGVLAIAGMVGVVLSLVVVAVGFLLS